MGTQPDPGNGGDTVALVVVCAWCGQPIGQAATAARRIVSHGMCRLCLEDMFANAGSDLAARR